MNQIYGGDPGHFGVFAFQDGGRRMSKICYISGKFAKKADRS